MIRDFLSMCAAQFFLQQNSMFQCEASYALYYVARPESVPQQNAKNQNSAKTFIIQAALCAGFVKKKIFLEKDTQKSDTDEMQIKSISSASPVIFICGKTKSLPYSLTGKRYFRQLILYNPPVFFPQVRNSTKSP